jgi:hypothetical protein
MARRESQVRIPHSLWGGQSMACCAFAVYLLSQLLWPLRWLRDRLLGAPAVTASASVAWSPAAAAAPVARKWRWKPALLLLLAAEVAGLGVAATAASVSAPAQPTVEFLDALHGSICSAVKGSLS